MPYLRYVNITIGRSKIIHSNMCVFLGQADLNISVTLINSWRYCWRIDKSKLLNTDLPESENFITVNHGGRWNDVSNHWGHRKSDFRLNYSNLTQVYHLYYFLLSTQHKTPLVFQRQLDYSVREHAQKNNIFIKIRTKDR